MASAPPPWELYGAPPPNPSAPPPPPATPRLVLGREPAPQTPAGAAVERGQADRAPFQTREAAANAEKAETEARVARMGEERRIRESGTASDAQAEVLRVIRTAIEARRLSREGSFTTGGSRALGAGRVAEAFPGSSAADLRAALDTIQGNVAFQRLQQMRQESPTGGAVGNVSDRDLALLSSTIASLDPNQSDERFQQSMRDVIDAYARVYRNLGGDAQQLAQIAATDPLYAQGPHATNELRTLIGAPPRQPGSEPPSQSGGGPSTAGPGGRPPGWEGQSAGRYDFYFGTPEEQKAASERDEAREAEARRVEEEVRLRNSPEALDAGLNALYGVPTIGPVVAGARQLFGDESTMAGVRGAQNVASFGLNDEIGAAARTAMGGTLDDNLAAERGIDAYDNQNNFGARLTGQLVGGLVLPTLGARGAGQNALLGGAYGGGYGFGSGEGGFWNRLGSGAVGASIGGGVGGIAGGIGSIMEARAAARAARQMPDTSGATPEQVANAMTEEGVRGGRPIADPAARGDMAYLETTRGGHGTIRESLETTRSGIEGRVGNLQGSGNIQTPGGMGEQIQNAGRRQLESLRRLARRNYDRAAAEAEGVEIMPVEMVQAIDENIARLERNPNQNRAVIDYMRSVRGDLVDEAGNLRPKSVADIRDMRTGLRDDISQRNLLRTRAEAMMDQVVRAGTADISRNLNEVNPRALDLYRRGDQIWTQLHVDERQIVRRLVGAADNPISGERAAANVTNMMRNRGDAARFRRVVGMMNGQERSDFAATMIESVGQRSPEEPFSPAVFLANTRDMQPEALRLVFGVDGARSIQNLRVISRAYTDTTNALNSSRSGFVNNFRDMVSSVLNLRSSAGGALGFMMGGAPGAVAGAVAAEAGQRGANLLQARTLMNPDVSRWIGRVATVRTPSAAQTAIRALGPIAARNPAISQEVLGLQRALMNAANDNFMPMGSVAASPNEGPNQQQ